MKSRTVAETAIMCATALIALALLVTGLVVTHANSKVFVFLIVFPVIGVGVVAWSLYLTTRKRAQIEQAGDEQYRRLADEYRRLADMAITAQEHTDLKLGDVSAQLDYLREQIESLQKILKEVE
jgi:phosphate/sulfate permease